MEKEKKSVSKLLDKVYGRMNYRGIRGRVLHDAYSKFFKRILKTADRGQKINWREFSQRITKSKVDILADVKKSPDYKLYHEDVNVLLNCLHKEIRQVGKEIAKENYNIIVPEEIEIKLFGGESSFELSVLGKIGGLEIPAQVDCLIEIDSRTFVVRDFKSYERDNEDDPKSEESQHHRSFMQVCLYAIIFENERHQICKAIELAFSPNKIASYDFSDELRETGEKVCNG